MKPWFIILPAYRALVYIALSSESLYRFLRGVLHGMLVTRTRHPLVLPSFYVSGNPTVVFYMVTLHKFVQTPHNPLDSVITSRTGRQSSVPSFLRLTTRVQNLSPPRLFLQTPVHRLLQPAQLPNQTPVTLGRPHRGRHTSTSRHG